MLICSTFKIFKFFYVILPHKIQKHCHSQWNYGMRDGEEEDRSYILGWHNVHWSNVLYILFGITER